MLKLLFSCIFHCYYSARLTLEGQIKIHSSEAALVTKDSLKLALPVSICTSIWKTISTENIVIGQHMFLREILLTFCAMKI